MYLNKHQIAMYDDLKHKVLEVWGGKLKVRVLTIKEQQEFALLIEQQLSERDYSYFLIKKCCVDENNDPIFVDGDEEILDKKSMESINYIMSEILALNKQKPDDVDDLAKN